MSLFKKGNNKELHNPEGREIEEADNKTLRLIISAVCLAFAVFGILTNSFFYINSLKKAGMFLGFTLCLIFLLYPTRIRGKALLPFDLLLSVLGLCCGLYTVLVTDRFAISNLVMTPMDLVMSILAITLVVIATKKAVGNAMAVLPVLFALYALLGKHIPGIFGHGSSRYAASSCACIWWMRAFTAWPPRWRAVTFSSSSSSADCSTPAAFPLFLPTAR